MKTARDSELPLVPVLLDAAAGRGFTPDVCVLDRGYDAEIIYADVEKRHMRAYQRQQLIRGYQADYDCRLIVMIGPIFGYSVEYFEELLYDASPGDNLHPDARVSGWRW